MNQTQAMQQAIRMNPNMSTKELIVEQERILSLLATPSPSQGYGVGRDKISTLSDASKYRSIGHNLNNVTIPLVRNLLTQTIEEFMPEIWMKLPKNSFERAAAVAVYEEIRKRAERSL